MTDDKDTLFFNNVRLVPYCYGKYYSAHKRLRDDFIQSGYLGLWRACLQFDPSKGKFSTFAMKCINWQMQSVLKDERKHSNEIGYIYQENNILELVDNGEFGLITAKIELDDIINSVKYKDDYRAYLEGETLETIANRNNVTRQCISNRCCRITKKLRQEYLDERENSL